MVFGIGDLGIVVIVVEEGFVGYLLVGLELFVVLVDGMDIG